MFKTNVIPKEEVYTHRSLEVGGAVAMGGSTRVVQGDTGPGTFSIAPRERQGRVSRPGLAGLWVTGNR